MAKRPIKFCLVYRDMWQSSGKYTPRVDQLLEVAQPIIDMGCFSRVETNGGGFEQINLLYGENPNKAVREWTQPFNDAGIQTQMLERALNGIRMSPVPADIRRLMFQVKKKQGTDISRSFCGLNDPRNMANSIKFAKESGMISQAALSLTFSPVHTVEYYINLAFKYIKLGADEICIKDMAGIGRPVSIGKIVKGIKNKYPTIPIQYHGHSTPGFSVASALESARAGADIIDVGMDPLSWGTGHADLLTIHAMLDDAGFDVPPINMKAYMKVRQLTQKFMDDFLGYYINPLNRKMNAFLIAPGLPGGMMGSLMADLEKNLAGLNKWLTKRGKPTLTQDELLLRLFDEVQYAWPQMGYPPLVTPYSQYVKNVSLMNVLQMAKGRERWSMVDENTWGMLTGRSGKLPGELSDELKQMAKDQKRKYFIDLPQGLYPNSLAKFRSEMDSNGWDYGQDDEELMELAMHPEQYRKYKSGEAKRAFEIDLAKRKTAKAGASTAASAKPMPMATSNANRPASPQKMTIDVNGEKFEVTVNYGDDGSANTSNNGASAPAQSQASSNGSATMNGNYETIVAPLEGTFYFTKEASERRLKVGDTVSKGDVVAYIESMKVNNAIRADKSGKIVEICCQDGASIEEDDIIYKLN